MITAFFLTINSKTIKFGE